MFNQPWNAQSASEIYKKQRDKEQEIQTQLDELKQQSIVLSDVKLLTSKNIECIKSILELTSQNTEAVKQIAQFEAIYYTSIHTTAGVLNIISELFLNLTSFIYSQSHTMVYL